ncbi:hypothetical protein [Aureliella helgolandensis]|uniref:Transmembrane protein n=1 Tax=Aureliella helgolandensis TaxID=2527968 RepID=A0A518G1G0_9BACT|nr:hypothetical protein [Aureliella helgolandensis]QDV22432.1 hypothetical protein Q31a_07170 [Aureliella helgolandensis]
MLAFPYGNSRTHPLIHYCVEPLPLQSPRNQLCAEGNLDVSEHQQTESPFAAPEAVRFGFGTMLIMLLTVVGAGVGLLIYYALRVPAITSELNAWLGRPDAIRDTAEARKAQVIFALFVYTAPLGLAVFVYGLHHVVNWINRLSKSRHEADDEFRME